MSFALLVIAGALGGFVGTYIVGALGGHTVGAFGFLAASQLAAGLLMLLVRPLEQGEPEEHRTLDLSQPDGVVGPRTRAVLRAQL